MNTHILRRMLALTIFAGAAGLILSGCAAPRAAVPSGSSAAQAARVVPAPARPPLQPPLPPAKLAALGADETGRIPILMYHAFGAAAHRGPRYDKNGLNIAPDTFRKQLGLMYAAGWYPVNMRDVLTSHIDIPAGKTPVVLTFDDARGTQFHYLPNGEIDPNCAVGILAAFHKTHPDWPLRGTFYILPKSAWNPVPFWHPGQETKKLRSLEASGYELANHSTTHRLMGHLSGKELIWEMAECQRYVRDRVPGAAMDTMALPGGAAPKDHALWADLRQGKLGDISYRTRCILMAWGGPSRSWADKKFDPDRVTRLAAGPGWIERAIVRLSKDKKTGGTMRPYVSDGNPDTIAVPRTQMAGVDAQRLEGVRLVTYGSPAAKPGPKPHSKSLLAGKGNGSEKRPRS